MPKKSRARRYLAHGLSIESPVHLPDLPETKSPAAVKIVCGELTEEFLAKSLGETKIFDRPGCRIRASSRGMFLEWTRVGKFLVRGGEEIIVEPDAEAEEADLQPFLTGPVLAILLHQREHLVLHASGVVVRGGAGASLFLGAKGCGKSTLAASMQTRGHQLISDDIVPLAFEGNSIKTFPGSPKIKLFADSIKAVGETPERLPLIHRWAEKYSFQCGENFQTAPIEPSGVYILAEGDRVGLSRLDLQTAFIEVARCSHLRRFMEALNCRKRHFEQCRKLIQTVPVFKLERPHQFDRMAEIGALLEKHALDLRANENLPMAA